MPEDGKPGDEPIKMEAPPAYEPWINEFLVWVQLEKGLSENTINSYETDLNQCACFLDHQNVSHWRDAGLEHFSAWMSSLTDGEYAVASLARKLSALRMMVRYLVGEGKLGENHTELLGNPKKRRTLPHCLTIEEMEKILHAPDLNTPLGKRDRALLELMYGSGLRVSEICSIPVNAIDSEEGFARVFGKGAKERVYLGRHAIEAVRNYLHGGPTIFTERWYGWRTISEYAGKGNIEKNGMGTGKTVCKKGGD